MQIAAVTLESLPMKSAPEKSPFNSKMGLSICTTVNILAYS